MSKLFQYVEHPRIAERRLHGPPTTNEVREKLHGTSKMAKFNGRVGLKITIVVGTMWCAYLFTLLALVSAPSAFSSGNSIIIIAWIAQTFLQLVLLPIIIVGQNIQAAASDKRAEDTYKDAEAVLHEAVEIQKHLAAQDAAITEIVNSLRGMTTATG